MLFPATKSTVEGHMGRCRSTSLLFACLLFGVVSSVDAAPPSPKKIGVIIALSGPIAPVGISIMNAVKMADDKFDAADEVQFLFEDDQFQAKHAVTAAEKLISQDKVAGLITFSAATSAAVSQLAERRRIPMVGVTALAGIGKGKRYVYSLYLAFEQQVGLLLDAVRHSSFRRVGMVTTVHDSMLEFRDHFKAKEPSRIVRDEEVNPGDIDLAAVATRILAQKPDVIVTFLLPPQIAAATKLLRDQGFTGPFIGGPPLFNPPEIKAARGAMDGALLPGPSSNGSGEFLARYQERFHEPCISEGLYGYDAAALMIKAAQSGDIEAFLMSATAFDGLLGTYPKSTTNVFQVPAELKRIGADGSLQNN